MYLRFTFTPNVPFTQHWQMKLSKMHATFTKSEALWNRCQKTDQNTMSNSTETCNGVRGTNDGRDRVRNRHTVCNICFNFCSFYVWTHITRIARLMWIIDAYKLCATHKQSILIELFYHNWYSCISVLNNWFDFLDLTSLRSSKFINLLFWQSDSVHIQFVSRIIAMYN